MATPSGRPLDDPSLARRFGGLDREVEQIKRELVKMPATPKPIVGGGVSGITRVWAWDLTLAANVNATPAGTFDITQRWGAPVAVSQSGTGLTLPDGLYMVTMDYDLSFDDTTGLPASGRVWMDYDGREYQYPSQTAPISEKKVGVWTSLGGTWTIGPLPISGSLTFGAGWLGSNMSAYVNWWWLDIAKVG